MKTSVLLLFVSTALAACGGGEDPEQFEGSAAMDSAAVPATAPAGAAGGTVTDPQIADIVVAANEVDVAAGELAQSRATDPRVQQFAQRMVTDHTGVNQQASQLVQRLGVTPEPSPTSQQLRQGGEQNRSRLQGLRGAEFDRAYIEHEVAYHQQVLDAIDDTLLPSAQNAELRALLEQVRPAIEAHLQLAQQIQGSLGGS